MIAKMRKGMYIFLDIFTMNFVKYIYLILIDYFSSIQI